MGFDQDAWDAEHAPWSWRTRGRVYVARPVSVPAVQRYAQEVVGDFAQQERALRRLLRLAFPWRLSFWWRGDPVRQILSLEPANRQAVVRDFFDRLRGQGNGNAPATNGTR